MDPTTATVWIVTDDEALRDATVRLLQRTTAKPVTFDTVEKFFGRASLNIPGCVLVDPAVPGIDALKLQHRLADLGSHLPVILLSGRDAMRTTAYAIRDEAFDLVENPFDPERLLEIVHAALEWRPTRIETWLTWIK
jgi:FixJ family two-component response regulator